jgi:DNA segregation ATPase FtsK/SpoIIIE, S-DNA-T family
MSRSSKPDPAPFLVRTESAPADRIIVRPAGTTDVLADLAVALGAVVPPRTVRVDGVDRSAATSLAYSRIRAGSIVGWGERSAADGPAPCVRLAVLDGPDAGRTVELTPGRHVIGLGQYRIPLLTDPVGVRHQYLVDVSASGDIALHPLLVDDGSSAAAVLRPGDTAPCGAVRLRHLGGVVPDLPSTAVPANEVDPWHVVHRRRSVDGHAGGTRPPLQDRDTTPDLRAPAVPIQIAPAVASLVAAGVVALIIGRPEIALFGVVGAGTSLGLALHARWRGRSRPTVRRRRVPVDEAGPVMTRRSIPEIAEMARSGSEALWSQRHRATARGEVVGVHGSAASAVARAIVVRAVTEFGPCDLRVLVVPPVDDPEALVADWAWTRWLPHIAPGDDALVPVDLAAATIRATDPSRIVLVVTTPAVVDAPSGPIGRLLDDPGRDVRVIVTAPTSAELPRRCSRSVDAGAGRDRDVEGVAADTALGIATALTALIDPLLPSSERSLRRGTATGFEVPDMFELSRCWSTPASGLCARLGETNEGVPVTVDLEADGPHVLVAGTTGSGKSELLRTLVSSLALGSPPHRCAFVLVDYKGGSAFDACARLPHVRGVVTDLDDELTTRMLVGLETELRHRESVLRAAGATDLAHFRDLGGDALARLVVVVDEFAALAVDRPDFLRSLVAVAQRGRSLGVHLVLATQRPGGVVSDDIRANTNLRIALRVQDTADAIDVVGTPRPAHFPRGFPGRAMVRFGAGEHLEFTVQQVSVPMPGPGQRRLVAERVDGVEAVVALDDGPRPTGPTILDEIVEVTTAVAAESGWQRVAPPWLPLLPEHLVDVPRGACGLLEDVVRREHVPLVWSANGHLVVHGVPRAGVTSALAGAVRSQLAGPGSPPIEIYAVADDPGPLSALLDDVDEVGDVIGLVDGERVRRLLRDCRHLCRFPAAMRRIVIIDGYEGFQQFLDDDLEAADSFAEVIRVGPRSGVLFAVGVTGTDRRLGDLVSSSPTIWRLDDARTPGAVECSTTGLRGRLVAPGLPTPRRDRAAGPRRSPPRPVARLPLDVRSDDLPAPQRDTEGRATIPLGVAEFDLAPVTARIGPGAPFVVLGPQGSGRTGILAHIASSWSDLHPNGVVLGPESDADDLAEHTPVLLVVDDAELVTPPSRLLDRLERRDPAVSVLVAGRPASLRRLHGHWTTPLRSVGRGIVLGPVGDFDADLLGARLPRRWPLRPRPGLGYLVEPGSAICAQFARRTTSNA